MLISTHLIGTPRPMIKLNYFIKTIKKQLDIVKLRYNGVEFHTGGPIEFVAKLLGQIDDPGVLRKDMLDVHIDSIMDDVPSIIRLFDSTESGVKPFRNTFIKSKTTEEIFIPTTGILGNTATALDGWSIWKDVQPIKLVSHDSDELKLYWFHQIKFNLSEPTFAVFAIDVEALLLKYIVYLREHNISLNNANIHEFINRHVIPFFYDDLIDIWVSRVLLNISDGREVPDLRSDDLHAASAFRDAVEEVSEYYKDLVRGKYRIADLLLTKFYMNGRSMVDLVDQYEEIYSSSMSRRHVGYSLLKMADITNIVTNALTDSRERGLDTATIRKLQYDVKILNRSNWQSHIRVDAIVTEVEGMLVNVDTLIL